MYQSLAHEHFEPRLQDAVFKGDPFMHYVKENQSVELRGGLAIRLGQVIQEGVFESFDRGDNATRRSGSMPALRRLCTRRTSWRTTAKTA